MIVVDTNVLSEFMRPQPDQQVVRWLESAEQSSLALTAISVMEITYGVARLPAGQRKDATRSRWEGIQAAWTGTFLPLGIVESVAAGEVLGARAAIGRPITTPDAQLAGICLAWGAALATRNTRDFDGLGIDIINPWE
jgi:predicted nucleic acid-binding protein